MSTDPTHQLEQTPKAKVQSLFPWAYTYELKYGLNPDKDWGQFYRMHEDYIHADKRELFARVKRGEFPDIATIQFNDLQLSYGQGYGRNLVCSCSMLKQMYLAQQDEKTAAHFQAFLDALYEQIILPGFDQRHDYYLQTRLHWAAATGQAKALSALCKHENPASLNTGDRYGTTALHLACQNGHVDCVAVLLENGADPNQPARLKYSVLPGHGESITRGEAPLHLAAEAGHLAVAKRLLAHQDIDIEALDGPEDWPSVLTALQIAERTEHHEIAELLRHAGAKMPEPQPVPENTSDDKGKEEAGSSSSATSSSRSNPFYQKTDDDSRSPSQPPPQYNMRARGQKFLDFLDEFVERECKHSVGRGKKKYQICQQVLASLKAAEERGEFSIDDLTIRTTIAQKEIFDLPEADRELFHGKERISLIDALKFQRHKSSDKNGKSKTPKSAAKLMNLIDPKSMKQHAVEFLETLLKKLNKTWPYPERTQDLHDIEFYINGIKQTHHDTLEGLCVFQMKDCERNLMQTLSLVGPPNWKGKKYEEFKEWFELDALMVRKKKAEKPVEEMHPVEEAASTPMTDFN